MSLRVGVVALNAYGVIEPACGASFGGIETRAWLFARGLARQPETDVSFVIRHGRPLNRDRVDGVRLVLLQDRLYFIRDSLLSRWRRTTGFPWVTVTHPRCSDAFYLPVLAVRKLVMGRPDPLAPAAIYRQTPVDVWLTFGVQGNSATVIASAHAAGVPAVLFLGSDSDLDARYLEPGDFVNVYRDRAETCLWTIKNADQILCQTDAQRAMLQERFGRDGTVVRNPIDLLTWDRLRGRPVVVPGMTDGDRFVLWIGRADAEHKRPQLLIELARRCPEVRFLMVMNPRDDVVAAEVRRTAPENVSIVDQVPFEEMPALMSRAVAFVNTSSLEGFPNTFLQAAASGVPVASLLVEEAFLRESGAGECARGDLARLASIVARYWLEGPDRTAQEKARRAVEQRHGLDSQVTLLESVLKSAMERFRTQH